MARKKTYTQETVIWFSAKSNMSNKSFIVKNDAVYPVISILFHWCKKNPWIKNNIKSGMANRIRSFHYYFGIKTCCYITNTMTLFFQLVSCHSHSQKQFPRFLSFVFYFRQNMWTGETHVVLIYFVPLYFFAIISIDINQYNKNNLDGFQFFVSEVVAKTSIMNKLLCINHTSAKLVNHSTSICRERHSHFILHQKALEKSPEFWIRPKSLHW